MGKRGMTIGAILLLVTIITLALFTVVAVSFFHLNLSNQLVDQWQARNLAESAIATALGQVWQNQQFGQARAVGETIEVASAYAPAESEGILTFNKAKASELGLPFSTNNFESAVSVQGGNGRQIPDSAVHLVALGRCLKARYRLEVIYYIPPYPNALAATGPVLSSGGLLVAGVESTRTFANVGSTSSMAQEELLAAHIVSNSQKSRAIQIGANSTVKGDVIAVGGIDLHPSVEVAGEVRTLAGKQPVPDLDVESIFTKLAQVPGDTQLAGGGSPLGDLQIDFFTEAQQEMVVHGDIYLNGGVLYCHKDLHVTGKVHGNGAVFGLGKITIQSGADVSAIDTVALVSKKAIHLEGLDKGRNPVFVLF